jgi:membrane protein YqaA with SNARE-associated domain
MGHSSLDVTSGADMLTTLGLYAATFLMGLVSGVVPFVINIEVYLVGVAALSQAPAPVIVGLATAGQMSAKFLLYQAGNGALNFRFIRWKRREAAARTFEKYRAHSFAVVAVSSLTGIPPFYGISLAAGALRLPLASFLIIGTLGRIVRFTVVYLAPGWLHLKG